MEQTTANPSESQGAIPSNVVEIPQKKSPTIEERLSQLESFQESFLTGLEDAARECLKNDMIRITLPTKFKDKIQEFIAVREKVRANAATQSK